MASRHKRTYNFSKTMSKTLIWRISTRYRQISFKTIVRGFNNIASQILLKTIPNRTTSLRVLYITKIDLKSLLSVTQGFGASWFQKLQKHLFVHLQVTNFLAIEKESLHNLVKKNGESLHSLALKMHQQAIKCNYGFNLLGKMRNKLLAGVADQAYTNLWKVNIIFPNWCS